MDDLFAPIALHVRALALWQFEETIDGSLEYLKAEKALLAIETLVVPFGKRPRNWVLALQRHESFWRTKGRHPRENTRNRDTLPKPESRLGGWGRYQRRFEENLSRYQIIRLDVSPSFRWDPHEEAWQKNLDACISHLMRTGRDPFHNSADLVELALARWLGRQMRQLQHGTQPPDRASRLEAFLAMKPIR